MDEEGEMQAQEQVRMEAVRRQRMLDGINECQLCGADCAQQVCGSCSRNHFFNPHRMHTY